MLDLTERVAQQQRSDARRADLDRRDKEHGGLTPYDRADEEKRRSVAGWGPYKLETSRADLAQARTSIDPRRVAIGRLWSDCGLAVRRWAKGYKRDAADTLRNDALLLLLRWEHQGADPRLDLGGSGGTPLRRDWIETVERADGGRETNLTRLAWRALHAAVKQAAAAPSYVSLELAIDRAEHAARDIEEATDPLDIAELVELQQRDADAATRLPDAAAAETVAHVLDLPLDAARAIIERAYPHATRRDLAETWGISPSAVPVSLSRGAKQVRERYPDPTDLLDALDAAASSYRAELERDAILALLDYRDGAINQSDALDVVRDWRGALDGMPAQQRALLAAARCAVARCGGHYGSERAELIAASVARLVPAEMKRARQRATIAARGSRLDGGNVEPGAPILPPAYVSMSIKLALKRAAEQRDEPQQQASLPAAPSTRKRTYRTGPRFAPVDGCRDCQMRRPHSSHPAQLALTRAVSAPPPSNATAA